MLTLLNIKNIALIEDLRVEFGDGLNLLTGETGSGKSIIVDALGILIGGRFTSDIVKTGESSAFVEGLFTFEPHPELASVLKEGGIDSDGIEIIIKREFNPGGRNKIFINNQLATAALLRNLRGYLVDIHGQGDQQTLFEPESHLLILDAYGGLEPLREVVGDKYRSWAATRSELNSLLKDQSDRYQLMDILRYQIEELERSEIIQGEDERLDEERRRLMNVEKLTTLSEDAFRLLYEESDSAVARIAGTIKRLEELLEYESGFNSYLEGLISARAVMEDLAFALRDYRGRLEFSPARLEEVETRLADLTRIKRKYGGTLEIALDHLSGSKERLANIEHSDDRERELRSELAKKADDFMKIALELHEERIRLKKKFEREVERNLAEVALENSQFKTVIEKCAGSGVTQGEETGAKSGSAFSPQGIDRVEFLFSANAGEPPKPLAKVASGGEASRLMLVLKTLAQASRFPRTIVFDEIDTGIGGRVAEAVGQKLKKLSESSQVLCVTHQAQIARFAESHMLVKKEVSKGATRVVVEELDRRSRVEEIARMLTGSEITETARRHARELLKV